MLGKSSPKAGKSARAEYERRNAKYRSEWWATLPKRLLILVGLSLLAGVIGGRILGYLGSPGLGWIFAVTAAIGLGRALFRPAKDVEAWRRGAEGEEKTERWLSKLPPEYSVLHDLAIPGSKANVDHLVIGPTGVFVVDSKNYSGKITENAKGELWSGRHPLARKIETINWEATQVSVIIDSPVDALLCVLGAELPRRNIVKTGVKLAGPRGSLRIIQEGPSVLGADDVDRLSARAMQKLGPKTG